MDNNSLAHTKWECKYHIVFAPKYRRQVIYKNIKADVGQMLGSLCRRKGIEIIEAECCPDHIHIQAVQTFFIRDNGDKLQYWILFLPLQTFSSAASTWTSALSGTMKATK